MQVPQPAACTQLPLFNAVMLANPLPPASLDAHQTAWPETNASFSELSFCGSVDNCLLLLTPVLRKLNQPTAGRWLTLIDPPTGLTQAWLRQIGVNGEVILLLQSRGTKTAVELASEALRLGRSHTVVSWIHPLGPHSRQKLTAAATQGHTKGLNIRLS